MRFNLILVLLSLLAIQLTASDNFDSIRTIEGLDDRSDLTFSVFGDNRGESLETSIYLARMVRWIGESDNEFVIGMGDHLRRGKNSLFSDFIKEHIYWTQQFFPGISKGEEDFFGADNGCEFIKQTEVTYNRGFVYNNTGCAYYVPITRNGYVIHLIQLNRITSESVSSKAAFLNKQLKALKRDKKSFVILTANADETNWLTLLPKSVQKLCREKADLIFTSNDNYCHRIPLKARKKNEPLMLDTGSTDHAYRWNPNGFIQIHVLSNPSALVVQYLDLSQPQREIQHSEFAWIKYPGKQVEPAIFRMEKPEENLEIIVGVLPEKYNQKQINRILSKLYSKAAKADVSYVLPSDTFPNKEVQFKDLWSVFPLNQEIIVLKLTPLEIRESLGGTVPVEKDTIRLAIGKFASYSVIEKLKLPSNRIERPGVYEIKILHNWVEEQSVIKQ
ncbi:MAG: hypothetical protein K8S56_10320 [Candidatus Cloacimonetes bacterium]|nr:hypothetical protein [Candidatus Cloacimonadota bacterium]